MHDDVRAVLNGTNPEGGPEGVVDEQREAVGVGNFGQRVNIGNVGIGIAQRFNEEGFRIGPDGRRDFLNVMDIDKGCLHAVQGEGVG